MRSDVQPRRKPSQRPRYRYVLVRLGTPLTRPRMEEMLRRLAPQLPLHLTRFNERAGILRCLRGAEADVRARLPEAFRALGVSLETLSTSGSLAALARRDAGRGLEGRRR